MKSFVLSSKKKHFSFISRMLCFLFLAAQTAWSDRPGADTVVVYVIDVSPSMNHYGGECGRQQNIHAIPSRLPNRILDCEIAAIVALNDQIIEKSNVGEVGFVAFASNAFVADVKEESGIQILTEPNSETTFSDIGPIDAPDNLTDSELEAVVRSSSAELAFGNVRLFSTSPSLGDGTSYSSAIIRATEVANASAMPNKMVVFFSDGTATTGGTISNTLRYLSNLGPIPVFHTFAVGNLVDCSSTTLWGSLQELAYNTGGTCNEIPNPSDLPQLTLPHVSNLSVGHVYIDSYGYDAHAIDVNDHSQVLGYIYLMFGGNLVRLPFVHLDDGTVGGVSLPKGYEDYVPDAINDNGQLIITVQEMNWAGTRRAVIVNPLDLIGSDGVPDTWNHSDDLWMYIPTLGGTRNNAADINNLGQVVGESDISDALPSETHPFIWSPSLGAVDLGTLGGQRSIALNILDNGTVTGIASDIAGDRVFFRVDPKDIDDDGTADTWFEDGDSDGINDLMTVISYLEIPEDASYPYFEAINSAGTMVGEAIYGTGHERRLLTAIWDSAGNLTTIPILDDAFSLGGDSFAADINERGIVAGSLNVVGGDESFYLPFIWSPESDFINLGGLSNSKGTALAINGSGDRVVGISHTDFGETKGAVWKLSNIQQGYSRMLDSSTGVSLTFDRVVSEGMTYITTSDTNPGPELTDFLFEGVYYDITTSAGFDGNVEICLPYAGTTAPTLQHLENDIWVNVTTSWDQELGQVCGTVTSFSWFAAAIDLHGPVARAGPDRVISCTSIDGATVTLDGSASYHPDGWPLTYAWTGNFGTAAGVQPTVEIPFGISESSLIVSDGSGDSQADFVLTKVVAGVSGLKPPLSALTPHEAKVIFPDRAFKQGRTLPLRLSLYCGSSMLGDADVDAPEIVSVQRIDAAQDMSVQDVDAGAANDNGSFFRYEDGNWVYNLSTKELASGTYVITIRMPDGEFYDGGFVLR